jgi:chromosome segregation ATPase
MPSMPDVSMPQMPKMRMPSIFGDDDEQEMAEIPKPAEVPKPAAAPAPAAEAAAPPPPPAPAPPGPAPTPPAGPDRSAELQAEIATLQGEVERLTALHTQAQAEGTKCQETLAQLHEGEATRQAALETLQAEQDTLQDTHGKAVMQGQADLEAAKKDLERTQEEASVLQVELARTLAKEERQRGAADKAGTDCKTALELKAAAEGELRAARKEMEIANSQILAGKEQASRLQGLLNEFKVGEGAAEVFKKSAQDLSLNVETLKNEVATASAGEK